VFLLGNLQCIPCLVVQSFDKYRMMTNMHKYLFIKAVQCLIDLISLGLIQFNVILERIIKATKLYSHVNRDMSFDNKSL